MVSCLRVVHFNHTFLELTENWVYNQIRAMRDVSSTVYCIARKNHGIFTPDAVRCIREDAGPLARSLNLVCHEWFHHMPQFARWLKEDHPDVLHAHFGPSGYSLLPYASRLNIPLVTSFYGADAYSFPEEIPCWRKRYCQLFRRGRLFLVEGPAMRSRLISLGCPPEKIIVHHIGIRPDTYDWRPRIPGSEVRLMVCGRFVEKKGIPYAIEVLAQVRNRGKTRVHLTIVGDSDSHGTMTREKNRILDAIAQHGVAAAVTMTGYIPHDELLKALYDHCVLLVPSVHACNGDAEGGFPVILTEAAATGMPIVAFAHCDIPEIVHDGTSGFLVPERNVTAMADKVGHLIEHAEIWPAMGRAGRAHVEANYNINVLSERLFNIYRSLLNA
jgi:colanic acid/amylovoran biosynthesis glycosyltransferase